MHVHPATSVGPADESSHNKNNGRKPPMGFLAMPVMSWHFMTSKEGTTPIKGQKCSFRGSTFQQPNHSGMSRLGQLDFQKSSILDVRVCVCLGTQIATSQRRRGNILIDAHHQRSEITSRRVIQYYTHTEVCMTWTNAVELKSTPAKLKMR